MDDRIDHCKRLLRSSVVLFGSIEHYALLHTMIRCHFSRLLGEHKLKMSDVARDTGVNRGTLSRLYYETAERVELADIEALCRYFECGVGEFLELAPAEKPQRRR